MSLGLTLTLRLGGAGSPPMPSLTGFIGATSASAVAANSVTVDVPAGAEAGDILVAVAGTSTGNEHNVPSGWSDRLTSNGLSMRSLGSYDGTTPNFTFTSPANTTHGIALLAFRGYDFGAATGVSSLAADPTPPSLTVPANDSLIVQAAVLLGASHTYSMPAGWTNRIELTTGRSVSVFERDTPVAAGSLAGTQITRTSGSTTARAFQFSLSPK
jgi:hypothetical protein